MSEVGNKRGSALREVSIYRGGSKIRDRMSLGHV